MLPQHVSLERNSAMSVANRPTPQHTDVMTQGFESKYKTSIPITSVISWTHAHHHAASHIDMLTPNAKRAGIGASRSNVEHADVTLALAEKLEI